MDTGEVINLSELNEHDKQLIKTQLEIILNSSYFNSAKQMKHFLEYIVHKALVGESALLKQYTIGVEALGLADDFDSDSNPVVRIMGGRVRNRLNEFYENIDKNEILISIPKGTYAPIFKYFANQATGVFSQNQGNHIESHTSSGPRLALISFTDVAQNKTSNRLLLQTTDTLAEELSHFVLFNLIVYNPYADKTESHGIGHDLPADYLLALYVQGLTNNKYELICRLTNVSNRETLWSKSFEINKDTPVLQQDDIIEKIIYTIADVHQGKVHINWERNLLQNKTSIPNKYKALAYFRQYYDNLDSTSFAEAISACTSALTRDSNDVIANIIYSDLCRRDYVFSYDQIESSLDKGIECAQRVIHLRPDSHEAHFALGQLLFSKGDWQRCEEELNTARNLTQMHSVIEYVSGYLFCLMGKWDKGISIVNKTMELSKTNPSWYFMSPFLSLYNQEKYEEALVIAKKITAPNVAYGPLSRCVSYSKLGNISKAKEELNKFSKGIPDIEQHGENRLLRMFGNIDLVEKLWGELEKVIKH